MHYNDLTRFHFETAQYAGVLAGPQVRRGSAGSRVQGTWVQFEVRVGLNGAAEAVEAVRFLAYGCPHVIAVADWIAQRVVGLEAKLLLPDSIQSLRLRFDVPIEKLGRLLIIEDAWIATLSSPYCE
jgi:NifU-like protein involved in Fe-S cluster formation